jgi:CubicO group peptidase (beta-lactamase class C family)
MIIRNQFAAVILVMQTAAAQNPPPTVPSADWQRIQAPESIGYSSERIDVVRSWVKTGATKGMLVVVGGRVLFEYGDVKFVSKIASVRKSVLGMLYGNYVANGKIDLQRTVQDVGLDDLQEFLPIEKNATLEMLLMSRSGVYLGPPETDPQIMPPHRGSQYPGTFFCYQNWDFNAAGTAFEKLTGKNIYDALEADFAHPLAMQDFDRSRQKKIPSSSDKLESVHPEYAMWLSTRDLARLGLLMLRDGDWDGKRVMPAKWSRYLTTLTARSNDLFPFVFKNSQITGSTRWGYGALWWVWDQPRYPGDADTGAFDGAYTAIGTGGHYLTVLPELDMVVSHKVDIDSAPQADVSMPDYSIMLQMLVSARCHGPCRK